MVFLIYIAWKSEKTGTLNEISREKPVSIIGGTLVKYSNVQGVFLKHFESYYAKIGKIQYKWNSRRKNNNSTKKRRKNYLVGIILFSIKSIHSNL